MEMTENAFSDSNIVDTPSTIFGNTIFIVIDPSGGGGGRSRMGGIAAYFPPRAGNIIVSLKSFCFKKKTYPIEQSTRLFQHPSM